MPINVFGSTLGNIFINIDTSSFVQKPYLRKNYIESSTEEEIDMKNHFKFKKIPAPIDFHQATANSYVNDKLNDPSIIKKLVLLISSIKVPITFVLLK